MADPGWSILCSGLGGQNLMLWTLVVVLIALWALGMLGSVGPIINVLLALALIVFLAQVLGGRSG